MRLADRFLRRSLTVFVIALPVYTVSFAALLREGPDPSPSQSALELVLGVVMVLSFIALPATIIVAWVGLARSTFSLTGWFRGIPRRLRSPDLTATLGSLRDRTASTKVVFSGLGAMFGILLLIGFGVASAGLFLDNERPFIAFVGVGALGVAGIALVASDFRRRRREMRNVLDRIDGLKRTLTGSEGGEDTATLRAWNQVAEIERLQIGRERAEALRAWKRGAGSDAYGLIKSRELIEASASLAPDVRLRVEEEADALTRNPQPSDAEVDAAFGTWRLHVPQTDIELLYAVDEAEHRIRLLSFREATASTPSGGSGDA